MTRLTSVGLWLILVLLPTDRGGGSGAGGQRQELGGRHQEIEDYLRTAEVVEHVGDRDRRDQPDAGHSRARRGARRLDLLEAAYT